MKTRFLVGIAICSVLNLQEFRPTLSSCFCTGHEHNQQGEERDPVAGAAHQLGAGGKQHGAGEGGKIGKNQSQDKTTSGSHSSTNCFQGRNKLNISTYRSLILVFKTQSNFYYKEKW